MEASESSIVVVEDSNSQSHTASVEQDLALSNHTNSLECIFDETSHTHDQENITEMLEFTNVHIFLNNFSLFLLL